jgi:hypothetical protein
MIPGGGGGDRPAIRVSRTFSQRKGIAMGLVDKAPGAKVWEVDI